MGKLAKVTGPGLNADNALIWQALALSAEGQLLQETLGNGLTTLHAYDPAKGFLTGINTGTATGSGIQFLTYLWDPHGNLLERSDRNQSVSEIFQYDTLDRLTQADLHSKTNSSKFYRYDDTGNLTFKSDVGSYEYGAGPAGPHAVTRTYNATGSGIFVYDPNGNMTSGGGRTISYTSFNQTLRIEQTGTSAVFDYDPERQRVHKTETEGPLTQEVFYLGGFFERLAEGANLTDKHYIFAGGALVAQYTKAVAAAAGEMTYLHTDYRNSIETTTGPNGNLLEHLSNDPHGKRRLLDWLDPPPQVPVTAATTTKGFTGHEQLDKLGVIHAGARLYDPFLGRFLSPDSTVQAPGNPQNLNRYSYCVNNPTSLYDPSGFSFVSFWKRYGRQIGAVVAALVIAVATWGIASYASGLLYVAIMAAGGAAAGATSAAITGGDILRSAWIGAAVGAIGAVAGGGVVTNSLVSGAAQELRGGKFIQGFLIGGLTSAAGVGSSTLGEGIGGAIGRVVIAAVVGGTASEITGGKFANGAITAGFAVLFVEGQEHLRTIMNIRQAGMLTLWPAIG